MTENVDRKPDERDEEKVARKKRPNAASIEEALRLGPEVSSVRIQLTLRPEYAARLEAMRASTKADTYTDVIRNAFNLYEKLHKQVQGGGRLWIETPAGERFIIMLD